jgi:5-methylcytosine-specific restriction endonuclease McrA
MRGVKHPSEEARIEALRQAKQAYELRNKEIIAAKKAAWYEANKEKLQPIRTSARKRHYENNRAQRIAYVRQRQGFIKHQLLNLSLAHQAEIDGLYQFCRIFSGFEVDHIIPLNGKSVCGMHVPWNLQVLPAVENRKKGNKYAEH